ncbi:hypothetical protein PO079_15455, partial [Bacteroides stercoris]|nr:hypothetical protein [Bacteroides stercoris]MDC2331846.1 hypothetical protein [Bacteroides stercoris]MDC2338165.1 hypothetical protein [Bacteroides stercoris]
KDTKSLGNNKAPACESRGFVRKKQKGCILTHLHFNIKYLFCNRREESFSFKVIYNILKGITSAFYTCINSPCAIMR